MIDVLNPQTFSDSVSLNDHADWIIDRALTLMEDQSAEVALLVLPALNSVADCERVESRSRIKAYLWKARALARSKQNSTQIVISLTLGIGLAQQLLNTKNMDPDERLAVELFVGDLVNTRAQQYYADRRTDDAIKDFTRLIDAEIPTVALERCRALCLRCDLLRKMKDNIAAFADANAAVAINPMDGIDNPWFEAQAALWQSNALTHRGMLFGGKGEHRQALRDFLAAAEVAQAPADSRAEAFTNAAVACRAMQDREGMRNACQRALGIAGASQDVRMRAENIMRS